MPKPVSLFAHQKVSINRLGRHERVLDLSDPGTGKTAVHLIAYARRVKAKKARCLLVIGPRTILEAVWEADIRTFTPHLTFSTAHATNREKAFEAKADIYITNHDAVNWLARQRPQFFARFTDIVIDEITAYKHHTSKRSRALAKIIGYFRVRRGLSGAINTNSVTDTWHPALLIDDGKRLGRSFYAFRGCVQVPTQVGPRPEHLKWEDKPNAEAVIAFMLRDMTIRHLFEDCVDIPKNFTYPRTIRLSGAHRRIYDQMRDNKLIELRANQKDLKIINAVNAAVLRVKLLQIASGAVYDNAGGYEKIDSERYELTCELVQEVRHSVVFFQWRHQRDEIIAEATRRGLTFGIIDGTVNRKGARQQVVDYFEKGFFDFVLVHPQSGAHGLTLVRGTRTIWPSPTDNLEWWTQAMRRIYRIGQTQKTETIVVLAADTYDQRAYERMLEKKNGLDTLNAYLTTRRAA